MLYLRRKILHLFLGFIALLFSGNTFAQYATTGTGTLRNQIWWLDWSGFTIANNATRTITTNNGLTITIAFSQVSPRVPLPDVMNTWSGATLHLMYDFTDPTIEPALYDANGSGLLSFTMTVNVTRNGVPVNFSFLAADAEASDLGETTTLTTNQGNWQTIEFFRNSTQTNDPLAGCGTQTAVISYTYGEAPQIGQNPLIATYSTGALVVSTLMDHGADVGGMGLAFGVQEAVDRGDLPPSFGTAWHELLYTTTNPCNYNPPYPATTQVANLMIGAVPGDADPIQYDNDDSIGVDEEGVSAFPPYNGSGTYSLQIPVVNTTGNDAYFTGWFDENRNGVFDPGESTTVTVPNNATSATLTWSGLPTYLTPGSQTSYGFRFRISSNQPESASATGYARDGEVEDYYVPQATLCAPMNLVIRPDTTVCTGDSVQLYVSGGGANQFTWSGGAGLSNPLVDSPKAKVITPTTYAVAVVNPQACQAGTSVVIQINPLPTVLTNADTTVCLGKPAQLTASGGVTYSWRSADGLFQATGADVPVSPANTTKYYVTVTDNNQCVNVDSTSVIIHRVSPFILAPTPPLVCKNDSLLLTASGGQTYAWSDQSGAVAGGKDTITVVPTDYDVYSVLVTDTICQVSETLNDPIGIWPMPFLEITKSNDINCTFGSAMLHVYGGFSYLWDSADGISSLNSYNPVVTPGKSTEYLVTVTDQQGCRYRDSIEVNVAFATDSSHYPIPSAFTPNNDGKNDCFGLRYWGHISSIQIQIYDRWGKLIFNSTDPNACWDGTLNGVPQPPGAYVYQIQATTGCATVYRKGTVVLVR